MTNSEAKAILNKINPFIDDSEKIQYFEAIELMLECFEENDKLKAEIEQLKYVSEVNGNLVKANEKLNRKIEQLKSELEKSIKLPCKIGDMVYIVSYYLDCKIDYKCKRYDEFGDDVCEGCEHYFEKYFIKEKKFEISLIEEFGKTVFLNQEEAEQYLKCKVEV